MKVIAYCFQQQNPGDNISDLLFGKRGRRKGMVGAEVEGKGKMKMGGERQRGITRENTYGCGKIETGWGKGEGVPRFELLECWHV
jgi:hypothetical protein